jgi:hypothetical protein
MDAVCSDQAPVLCIRAFTDLQAKDVVARLGITLFDGLIRVASPAEVARDLQVQVLEVLSCSLKSPPRSI